MTDTIESLGKIILGLAAVLAPLVKLYLEMLKARSEADCAWEKVRHYETGVRGLKRKKNYLPWRPHAGTTVRPETDLGSLRNQDSSSDHPPGAGGGSEEQR